jgi:hypothetical protein
MNIKAALFAVAAVGGLSATPAHAVGCLTGGAAGAVAGHYAGHHAVLGAIGGCIAGHHLHKVQEEKRRQQMLHPAAQNPAPDGATPDSTTPPKTQ